MSLPAENPTSVAIEDIRDRNGQLVFLRVKKLYLPRRRFGRVRLQPQEGHDVTGWISGMGADRGTGDAYVILLPSWTSRSIAGIYVYLRDIDDLQVLVANREAVLPGQCQRLEDLQIFLADPQRFSILQRLSIELHLQWCTLCNNTNYRFVTGKARSYTG